MGPHFFLEMPLSERALIFDVDGTLVDSNDAHAAAWAEALRDFEIDRDVDAIVPLIGMGGDKLLPRMAGVTADSELGRQIGARRAELFRSVYFDHIAPFPGVRDLFERLRDDGVRIAIASSAGSTKPDELAALLELARVRDLVDRRGLAAPGEVASSKPAPDAVDAALGRLGLAPGAALVVGDSPFDIEAATGAGLRTIAFRCGGWGDRDLEGALIVYDGPQDMLSDYDRRSWDWPGATPARPGGPPAARFPANSSLR
jgi:HAD superfamily hydrolase (TIGR01509 family)